jgi:hypothetical protein
MSTSRQRLGQAAAAPLRPETCRRRPLAAYRSERLRQRRSRCGEASTNRCTCNVDACARAERHDHAQKSIKKSGTTRHSRTSPVLQGLQGAPRPSRTIRCPTTARRSNCCARRPIGLQTLEELQKRQELENERGKRPRALSVMKDHYRAEGQRRCGSGGGFCATSLCTDRRRRWRSSGPAPERRQQGYRRCAG